MEQYNHTLGSFLHAARKAKNLTLEELSLRTKIHKTLIHSLEENNFLNLPNRIYVNGFLKSLSEALGFELKEAMNLYRKELDSIQSGEHRTTIVKDYPDHIDSVILKLPLFNKRKRVQIKWLALIALALVVAILLSPLFLPESLIKEEVTDLSTHPIEEKPLMHPRIIQDTLVARPVTSSQQISLTALKSTWIAFRVDKNPVRKFTLKKGSSITLKGESINLMVGNYKGVKIENNKMPVAIKKPVKTNVVNLFFNSRSPAHE